MKNKNHIFSIFFILVAAVCVAQVPPGISPNPPNAPDLPIDGGLLFLVISAILFGIKKLKH